MAIEAKGHLLRVDLRNGIISARMKEGWLKERDISVNIGQDPEFLHKLATDLKVLGGDTLETVTDIDVGRMVHGLPVQEHRIRIIIE